jgi:hypothetical protein
MYRRGDSETAPSNTSKLTVAQLDARELLKEAEHFEVEDDISGAILGSKESDPTR